MTKTTNSDPLAGTLDTASELLPWLVTRRLSAPEHEAVQAHLEDCEQCVAELEDCAGIRKAFALRRDHADWEPPAGHFDRLLDSIDQAEAARQTPTTKMRQMRLPAPFAFGRLANRRSGRPMPGVPRWAMALGTAAALLLVIVGLSPSDQPPTATPLFETLSRGNPGDAVTGSWHLSVMLDGNPESPDIQDLLKRTDGRIIAGPSALGIYTIELPPAMPPGSRVETLRAFRSHPKVSVVTVADAADR